MKDIKLEDLVNYLKNNDLAKSEILYLIRLYEIGKNTNTDEKIEVNTLFKQLSILNAQLSKSNNTELVSNRLNKEIVILEEVNNVLQNYSLDKVADILYEIELLAYESGVEIHSINAKELLMNKLYKKEDENAIYNR